MVKESDSKYEEKPYVASDDKNHVSPADVSTEEESDIEQKIVIEQKEEYDSEESVEDELVPQSVTFELLRMNSIA